MERTYRIYSSAKNFVDELLSLILQRNDIRITFDRTLSDPIKDIINEMNNVGMIFKVGSTRDGWTVIYASSYKIYLNPLNKDICWPYNSLPTHLTYKVKWKWM